MDGGRKNMGNVNKVPSQAKRKPQDCKNFKNSGYEFFMPNFFQKVVGKESLY